MSFDSLSGFHFIVIMGRVMNIPCAYGIRDSEFDQYVCVCTRLSKKKRNYIHVNACVFAS